MTRDHFIKVRVTETEFADFRARASEAGMTVSDLVRFRLTGYRVRQTDSDKDKLRHLARIGSNVNQLARWANSRKAAAPALEVALWLSRLVDGINDVAGEEPAHDD
jgi:NRPS condensation-like uncharacterized protein